jgi:hypothetical protein
MNLLLLVHFDPSLVPAYQAALAPLADRWVIGSLYLGPLSGAYTSFAARERGRGKNLIHAALAAAGDVPGARWTRLVVASFSAGYALVREMLRGPEADLIDGWIGIDSGHAALDRDGTALDAQVEPFVRLARRAIDGKALLWLGHSDVRTPQAGHSAFASTTQFADELLRLVGVEATPAPVRYVAPLFVVRAFDEAARDHEEHVLAARGWGPAFVAHALATLDGASAEVETDPAAPAAVLRRGMRGELVARWQATLGHLGHDPGARDGIFGSVTQAATLAFQAAVALHPTGEVDAETRAAAERVFASRSDASTPRGNVPMPEAILARAIAELREEAREIPPGSNAGPFVERYFAGTKAAPPANWCAAFVRWCLHAAAKDLAVEPPIKGSVGAKAFMEQFRATSRWRSADELRREPSHLQPGDVVVWHRGAPEAWTGHIGIVLEPMLPGRTFVTIEGNAPDRVARVVRQISDPLWLGAGRLS